LQPFLLQGFAVSFRTVAVMSVIMCSSAILARVDAASQAANEILRQVWIVLFQFVECLNISNQSITAGALGAHDVPYAMAVVKRHLLYAVALFSSAGAVVLACQHQIVSIFTADAMVVATAATTLPLLVACFPLDAVCSMFDGTLTAAGQATWTARTTTYAAIFVVAVMLCAPKLMQMSLFRTWCCAKLMTLLRMPMLVHRVYMSEYSPFADVMRRDKLLSEATEPLPHQSVTQPTPSSA
jgi:Na+-driven multidrug efflux pump